MKKLKLRSLNSYKGYGIEATREKSIVTVEDDVAKILIRKGYFKEVDEEESTTDESSGTIATEKVTTKGSTKSSK